MTIMNNIEIDNIDYTQNLTKTAILNNDFIDNKLHVIIVISNPCHYARRYILAKQFIRRMVHENNVQLHTVELSYDGKFYLHSNLQLHSTIPIWHKESMINVAVKKLLPSNWKAMAWIDADIEFESATWASDCLKILNGYKDIVQLFSHCIDMDKEKKTMNVFNSFGYQYENNLSFSSKGLNYWHPGYAWACTRKAYEKMNGLYDMAILGSGDNIMALSLIGRGLKAINENSTDEYKSSIIDFQSRVYGLRLGYVPTVIKHYYHGSKYNRKYTERWQILLKNNYNPCVHLSRNEDNLIKFEGSPEFAEEIFNYFKERKEDD